MTGPGITEWTVLIVVNVPTTHSHHAPWDPGPFNSSLQKLATWSTRIPQKEVVFTLLSIKDTDTNPPHTETRWHGDTHADTHPDTQSHLLLSCPATWTLTSRWSMVMSLRDLQDGWRSWQRIVSAPLQNNSMRFSGVLTENKQSKQSNHMGPLSQEHVGATEGWQKAVPMMFVSDTTGG